MKTRNVLINLIESRIHYHAILNDIGTDNQAQNLNEWNSTEINVLCVIKIEIALIFIISYNLGNYNRKLNSELMLQNWWNFKIATLDPQSAAHAWHSFLSSFINEELSQMKWAKGGY